MAACPPAEAQALAAVATAGPAGDAPMGFGGFHRAGLQLALPMGALREVLPCGALAPLPCSSPAVVGAVDLRGVLLPVLDLCRLLGRPLPPRDCSAGPVAGTVADTRLRPHREVAEVLPGSIVIVLAHDGHLLGLLADDVTGVFVARAPGLHPLLPGADPLAALVAGSLSRADSGEVLSLLAPAAVAGLQGVPWLLDPEPARQRPAEAAGEGAATVGVQPMRPMMLLRCAAVALAIDAIAVHATLTDPELQRSVLSLGECLGVIDYGGQRVPVLDLLALLGLGSLPPDEPRQAFVLKLPQGMVALLISEVVDVVRTLPTDVIAVPACALPRPALVAGALPVDALPPEAVPRTHDLGPQYLVLDEAALCACGEVQSLAATNTEGSDARQAHSQSFAVADARQQGRRPMLVYALGSETATPIEQVQEILPFKPEMATYRHTQPLLGMVVVRGRSIPVMCLSGLSGLPAPEVTPAVSVLVVEAGGELLGFAVPRLVSIEPAQWEPALPTPSEHRHDDLSRALKARALAQVGHDGEQRMLRVLNLVDVARALQQRAALAS